MLAYARKRRHGVSLVEIAIVIAIFGIMSGLAAQSMVGMVPSYRTKRAAREFYVNVQKARDLAISEGREYRIRVDAWDSSISTGTASIGSYYIERGDAASLSVTWDVLPVNVNSVVNDQEGHIVFTRDAVASATDAANPLPWVSLEQPLVTTIVFDSRGFLENSSSDFDSTGMVNFNFVNKRAAVADGMSEFWTVSVSRAGFARLSGTHSATIGAGAGTNGTTTSGGSGSGYQGASAPPMSPT